MQEISAAFGLALGLIVSGDPELAQIVLLSLQISLSAVALAAVLGMPLGAALALFRFPGRGALVVLLNACMGLPPVVVGLFVYLMLSRAGPLGELGLLFTPTAMVIAQAILVTPIIAALTRQTVEDLYAEYREQLQSLGVGAAARHPDPAVGRPLQPAHGGARRLRPGGRRGRRGDHRRRQHQPRDPGDDHHHRARDQQGLSRPGARPGPRPAADRGRGERRA